MTFQSWDDATNQLPSENWDAIWSIIGEKIPALKPYVQQMSGWNYQTTEILRQANTLLTSVGVETGIEEVYVLSDAGTLPAAGSPDNAWGYQDPGTVDGREWVSVKPNTTDATPYLYWAIRPYTGTPAAGEAVSANWSRPIIIERPDLPESADSDLFPFSYSMFYDLRQTVFGAAVDPGEYILKDAGDAGILGDLRLRLSWDRVDMADTYEYRFREVGAAAWQEWQDHDGTTEVLLSTAEGLIEGTEYEFQVRGVDTDGVAGLESGAITLTFES